MSKYPRVLIISHNVFSNASNMGRTLANFFVGWPKEKLAQLYLHSEIPTVDVCTNYFRITDFDNIKKAKKQIGTKYGENGIHLGAVTQRVDDENEAKIYQRGRKRAPYMYLGRNFLWRLNRWHNKKLSDWFDDFAPEVIFYASGDYAFSYRIAAKIAKERNIPIVSYVCDDYYFGEKHKKSLLGIIANAERRGVMKKTFGKYPNLIAICDQISRDYAAEFHVNARTVMTTSMQDKLEKKEDDGNVKISYLGNVSLNRYLQLADLGRALNKVTDGKIRLDLYTGEKNEEMLSMLTAENGIDFHGSVSYDEVLRVMAKSDILVHTESFDEITRKRVRYSVSTKIADSLASGRCLLAYGPDDVASIAYLKENDAAYVISKKSDLEDKLKKIIESKELREEYAQKGYEAAKKFHSWENNCEKIRSILAEVAEEYAGKSDR